MSKRFNLLFPVLFSISILGSAFGQQAIPFLYFETHIFPTDTSNVLTFVYRVPYSRFVFIKDGNKYKADFRLTVEVTDSLSRHVARQIDEKSISTAKYEETASDNDYFEGLTKIYLKKGNYHLLPIISDINSNREIKLPEASVNTKSESTNEFLPPLIVQHTMSNCNEGTYYELTNFNNCFPFSEDEYDLIIPAKDTSLKSIHAVLINNIDTVFNSEVSDSFVSSLMPSECGGKIILQSSPDIRATRNFVIKSFSRKMEEGNLRIFVLKEKIKKKAAPIVRDIVWFNKPFSLQKPAEAIKLLKFIEKEPVIDSLLKSDPLNYSDVLFGYWKKYDPTAGTEFNPLMYEYYLRVDYAVKHFSTLSGKNGAETDRGITYIKYGNPKSIERFSDDYGKIVEKWVYENPLRVFEFVDQLGTGNYTLKK